MLGYICNFHRSIEVTTSASGRDALRAVLNYAEPRVTTRYSSMRFLLACLLVCYRPLARAPRNIDFVTQSSAIDAARRARTSERTHC